MAPSDFVTTDLSGLVPENATLDYNVFNDESFLIAYLIDNYCHISLENLSHCLVFSFFTITGVLGNTALLFAILLNKHLLSTPNIFIVNLTIADLLYILTTAPFNIRHELIACWLLGSTACKIKHYIPLVAQGACVFTLVALSCERYSVIVKGLESRLQKSSRRTLLIIGSCWLAGLIIGIPVLLISETNTYGLLCQYMPINDGFTLAKGYIASIFMLLYVLPFLSISINYIAIAHTLCKNNITQLTDNNPAALRQMQGRKRLAVIVITIAIFFGLFWFPYHVYHIWYMFTKHHAHIRGNKVQFFRHLYNYMSLANSCLNPWAVFLMSSAHRSPLNRCFRKLCCTDWRSKINRERSDKNIFVTASTSVSKV